MSGLFARKARLPEGWARDIRLTFSSGGTICRLEKDTAPKPTDAKVEVLIPAMANVHSHGFQRAMAGLTENGSGQAGSFWTWRNLMYKLANQVSPEDLLIIASQLYMELLKSGYTSVGEFHYLHRQGGAASGNSLPMSEALAEAAENTGIALTHLPVLYETSGFGADKPTPEQSGFYHKPDDFVSLLDQLKTKLTTQSETTLGIAFHSLRAVKQQTLAEILAWSANNLPGCPLHIHIAEQEREVTECLDHYGARPVEWLMDQTDLNNNWCLIHATHMLASECEKAASTGAIAGLCPTTEANLGDGFFDITPWKKAGGAWGIGSDANVCMNPAEELRLLEYGARLRERRRLVITSTDTQNTSANLWQSAAEQGARALGRKAGSIAVGQKGDLLGLKEQHIAFAAVDFESKDHQSLDTVLDCLIFGPSEGAVREVFVAGQQVIHQGRHAKEDEISARFHKVAKQWLRS
jgi:formimidoylglutamate deiminase